MAFNPKAPQERQKAKLEVDVIRVPRETADTIVKTPKVPAAVAKDDDDAKVNEGMSTLAGDVNVTAVQSEINVLDAEKAKVFKKYVLTFNPSTLPKGAQKAYISYSEDLKICWLFLRFKCQSQHLFLSGFVELRELTDDELDRCIYFVISTDVPITDVREIPATVLGFPLNATMLNQVENVLSHDKKLFMLFGDRLKFWQKVS